MFSIEAVDRIEEHNKKDPMFLYLSYQAVHSANQVEAPLQAPQKWINKFQHIKNQGRRKYAAMVAAMDDGVGKVCVIILTISHSHPTTFNIDINMIYT